MRDPFQEPIQLEGFLAGPIHYNGPRLVVRSTDPLRASAGIEAPAWLGRRCSRTNPQDADAGRVGTLELNSLADR
jgi:hypothetical protein